MSPSRNQPKYTVVVVDDYPPTLVDSPALDRLRSYPSLDVQIFSSPCTVNNAASRIKNAHTVIIVHAATQISSAAIEGSPNLRHIALLGRTTEAIPVDTVGRLGIVVTNALNEYVAPIAEHAMALVMALAKRIPEMNFRIRDGEWPGGFLTQLSGKIMGIVGINRVGARLAQISEGMGMRVLATDTPIENQWGLDDPEEVMDSVNVVDFETLLTEADVVCVHIDNMDSKAKGTIFNREQFSLMKPTTLFINTGTPRVLNEAALAEALSNDTIAGAALDSFSTEPIARNNPLFSTPKAIMSPHISLNTPEALEKGLNTLVDNVISFFEGRVKNRVVP